MNQELGFETIPFEIAPEFRTSTSDFEMGAASHPTLGPGRRVSRQGEFEESGTSMKGFIRYWVLGGASAVRLRSKANSKLSVRTSASAWTIPQVCRSAGFAHSTCSFLILTTQRPISHSSVQGR